MKKLLIISLLIGSVYADIIDIPGDYPTIQEGLDVAVDGDTVYVQAGTYYENIIWPSINGIKLIGEDRNSTIINGNQSGSVVAFENIVGPISTETLISTLTITNGYGNDLNGGGISLIGVSPRITDITIISNHSYNGGGICMVSSFPEINNTSISDNSAINEGGGITMVQSSPRLTDVNILNNYAAYGAGITISTHSDPRLENVEIKGNESANIGGGIYLNDNIPEFLFYNIIIHQNSAQNNGGGIWGRYSNGKIINSVITNNIAEYQGGGMYFQDQMNIDIKNSIIINNTLSNYIFIDSEIHISYSLFDTIFPGVGNINGNPLFTDPENGDYMLEDDSPCIDTGTADIDDDGIDDITDYYGTAPDMGAYEYFQYYSEADINADGIVNIQDLLLILEFILEYVVPENWQIAAADVNLDGEINIIDITYIVSHRILSE
tara:strand:+ start:486 stop:1796 length:1311 start_codon:yes stop_codon:yes gene_type:complete